MDIDPDQVLQTFIGNKVIGQFSKGKALRYSEMTPEDQALFLERFADLHQRYRFDTERAIAIAEEQKDKVLRPRGEIAMKIRALRRRFRYKEWGF